MTRLEETFRVNLAAHPYCTDELGVLYIRTRPQAVKKRYIQPNKPADLRWLCYDVDSPTASTDWIDLDAPVPNIIIQNPENGHAHYLYGLEVPVYTQHGRRDNPFRFAAAVDVAMTEKLNADRGFAKLITKNPLRGDFWAVAYPNPDLYDLNTLSRTLDLNAYRDTRRNLPAVGLGRNCTLFDRVRFWAYRAIRRDGWINFDFWAFQMETVTRAYNDFFSPLPDCECRSVSKSVAKWVWGHMSKAGFLDWCSRRGIKSGRVRQEQADELTTAIRDELEANPNLSPFDIAERFNVSYNTAQKRLKKIRG